jgi:hypothetical protein
MCCDLVLDALAKGWQGSLVVLPAASVMRRPAVDATPANVDHEGGKGHQPRQQRVTRRQAYCVQLFGCKT